MRITTGKYKGRIIWSPKGIRPTEDRVRKALFDILGDIEGLSFLEIFAGSGAVGFEAISRGVKELTLVEYNRDCLRAINKNIESLKERACELYEQEADEAIRTLGKENKKFDIIFLDPPYYQGLARRTGPGSMDHNIKEPLSKKTLQTLEAYDILTLYGIIAIQHSKKENLPKESGNLALVKQAKYADTLLSFYRKKENLVNG
ncbi:MAG: 16S rRNA (guanine(966)-N(2))-methyltransferase RsmD [Candidatus Omnitrophica bacterium]|nr:16S rRNA (guanine(966)-N(2))-methyltransferase RsmD [Candidatus Omnitrophota bacterium]MBU1928506.1 16S rRNA (guanine(966)-N(2))-methyltransferase RsmD [Candidatus Omnitrophota bacterium]MBU2034721.1 16S rRNA (guanine(966)-N(2))-methyltransferase RsmD [Candidatus Omnitrophota bacterium]MBU2222047.1 16S rRNA (guanine(966)-N(2))-methyltransferase RsmD [Candidatus Omnitrophota bacterium]MBU2257933.1 16S rRNA (guanine(966)-N(2))-methyltransferase RsmD [Candidatus Omnitrophota bacterium]